MTEMNQKIFDMIAKNASVNEICQATGLSSKQLFHRLNMFKIKGFNFSREYYSDGEICYKLDKNIIKEKENSLITKPSEQEIKAIFISDLHISNEKQRLDLFDQVYELCIREGIHVIINGGDLIDGLVGQWKKKFDTYEKQIDYLLRVHPFDKNILNFICFGNHDIRSLEATGQNLETVLNNKRHDIVSLGYGYGELNIKNDKIIVVHQGTSCPGKSLMATGKSRIVLYGHGHISKNEVYNNNDIRIHLPSLSDIGQPNNLSETILPSIIKATISFKGGYFYEGNFEQYIFLDKMYKVNESQYQLFSGKNIKEEVIKYEEDRTSYKEKTLKKSNFGMSQIEKFNQRYGGHVFTALDNLDK